jgi:hypothetical protein
MNPKDISPKASSRMNRIRIVSRIAKYVCFVFLAFSVGFNLWGFIWSAPSTDNVGSILLLTTLQIVMWIWYWKLTRLFHFYERGLIFAAETIRCIKTLGLLYVIGWALTAVLRLLPKHAPPPTILSSHITLTATHSFHMGFFSFDFGTGIDFGGLLTAITIILVAWIMDEGRKIQEEQELTV